MNIKVGLSIYNKPWLIEPQAGLRLLDYFERAKAGAAPWNYNAAMSDDYRQPLSAYELQQFFQQTDQVVVAPDNRFDMRDFKGFDGAKVAVVKVEGALMKADFCDWFGTASLREMVQLADRTGSIETILLVIDSPGGTVDGTEALANAVKNASKRTIAVVDGLMCSAAYWIGSSANETYCSLETDIVGSIGTQISWYDRSKYHEEIGFVLREYHATQSVDKNAAYREANKGDGRRLVQEMLDPLNNVFLSAVKANRSGKINESTLTGKTYTASDAVRLGLVDGIKSFDTIVSSLITTGRASAGQSNTTVMSKTNLVFQKTMTAAKAAEFPVVDGGFMLTEDQLNAIEAVIDQHETIASATAAQLKALQSNAAAEQAAKDLTAAQEKIKTLETDLAKAKTDLEVATKSAGGFFHQVSSGAEPKGTEAEIQAALDALPHNRLADERL